MFSPVIVWLQTSCTGLFNHCLSCCVAASFGTGSMSMPAGFGNPAAFNLPTSFSGTFQQPFPGQAPFPQPPAYPQQPNGVCLCVHYVDTDISASIMLTLKPACAADCMIVTSVVLHPVKVSVRSHAT